MADFEKAIVKTLINEGGVKYTELQDDKGGATKYGICKRANPNEDIKNLTETRAREIYRIKYWNPIKGDQIKSQEIAENIFDTCVNMGVKTGSRLVQVVLGIKPVDGIIGEKTLSELNSVAEGEFLPNLTLTKIARYAHICNKDKSQTKFLLGWINRALGGAA